MLANWSVFWRAFCLCSVDMQLTTTIPNCSKGGHTLLTGDHCYHLYSNEHVKMLLNTVTVIPLAAITSRSVYGKINIIHLIE